MDRAQLDGRQGGLEALAAEFGDAFSASVDDRRNHGAAEGFHVAALADAVLRLTSTEAVSRAMVICARHGLPVIAYGTGSSLEGQLTAVQGGVVIDLSGMDRVLEVEADDLNVLVEAGVTREALNVHLRDTGLFFPVDPGANASLGGMTATRASGTTTIRYGGMRQNVIGLTVVLASGQVIRTGGRARKSSAGYDLTALFVGSEGTLGVITEIRLRLHPQPESVVAAVCPFATLDGAVAAVIGAVQSGLDLARIEFLDTLQMRAVNAYSGTAHAEQPTLFLEFHGDPQGVSRTAEAFREIAAANGATGYEAAVNVEDRNRLWQARHRAYFAALALAPGKVGITTDVCVPISRLADCITQTSADIAASGLIGPIVGHVGDGNFHCILLVDPADAEEVARAKAVSSRIVHRALAVGGTCTGEHGVGLGKMGYLVEEAGDALAVMRAIKAGLDPAGLLNPGKIFQAL